MGKTKKKHEFAVRQRAFKIWQNLGYFPWRQPGKGRRKDRDFYKGAFDTIPFMNEDGKRTFSHLMLRPGYMIRDYINGKHDNYLAPLASLIIFYAFFALVAAVMQPVQQEKDRPGFDTDFDQMTEFAQSNVALIAVNTAKLVQRGYIFMNLDRFPEQVDTRGEVALAALEGKVRSQGIPLFLGKFLLLWLSMSIVLRRYKVSMSAAAAAASFVLCQFSFFMIFAVLLSFGESTSISLGLMAVLLTIDYHQWLGLRWRKSIGTVLKTGLFYGLMFLAIILLVSLLAVLISWIKL